MAKLKTSKGFFEYKSHLLYFGNHKVKEEMLFEDLKILALYLDKIGINWGPAFGTLIGIIRGDNLLPWNPVFDIYILKEDEERFKDVLWLLLEVGFKVVRYERRGLYYLERCNEYFKVFVLHKISSDVRHTGGSDFIQEKYIQNSLKWNFHGVQLNIPAEVDEYLSFRYGDDWYIPLQTKQYKKSIISKWYHWGKAFLLDHFPDNLYYRWVFYSRQKDFKSFKKQCESAGIPLSENVQLSSMQPRKYKKVLTVGVYDLLHKGHVELYRRAKGLGDYLILAVQEGDFILKYKPTAKILNPTEDRKYMIKSIRYVDEVITYEDVDEIVKQIDFDVFVTGPDQCHEGFQRAIRWCEEHGREHIILARTDGVSSSELKAKITDKNKK